MLNAVKSLVSKFKMNETDCYAPNYREHQLRVEYINPLFELLGWDVINKSGRPVSIKDVVHEDVVRVEGRPKAPDYGFRVEGARRFFVEAKRPAIGVSDKASALQIRRYGWNAKLAISILTDFATISVYDCRASPEVHDSAENALLISFKCEDFATRWDEINLLLSRDAVAAGSLDQFVDRTEDTRGFVPVDKSFLSQIENWRAWLAQDMASLNSSLSVQTLNECVQLVIDRIVFLRIAEDRGIEPHGRLHALCGASDVYSGLINIFYQADKRYNSGLFHFQESPAQNDTRDTITPTLKVSDHIITKVLRSVYRPESVYEFSVIPSEILGQIYEQFLGKVIRLTSAGAVVDNKPEVKKAGGVYYTPSDIVRHIVEQSLKAHLSIPPLQISSKKGRKTTFTPLRVLDPACGSGSFLIETYQQLLDWHLDWYVADDAIKHARGRTPKLFSAGENGWRLSIAEKRRILLTHVYGVDIDKQAVEVTKLSLLLKMLEGESSDALAAQMDLFEIRVLPDISANIKCGNSVVSTDIIPELLAGALGDVEISRNNPFNWESEYPFLKATGGFDVIVGNPPYIDSEWMSRHWPLERRYCSDHYAYASGNWDIFCVFTGRAIDLLRSGGSLSFIVPNKIMTATYAGALRQYLATQGALERIRDYSMVSVFPVAVYPIVFLFRRSAKPIPTIYEKVLLRTSARVTLEKPITRQLPASGDEWRMEGDNPSLSNFTTLGDLATICDAATVSEAYMLRDLLRDNAQPGSRDFCVVNSGTIDPYIHHWGRRPMRYIKSSLMYPTLLREQQSAYSQRRIEQARTPKILIANMTRRIEAIFDEKGELLAAKSVTVVLPNKNAWLILAILNSNFMSKFYEERFHGRKMAGGYLQVVPAALRQLPIPNLTTKTTVTRIETLCRQLMLTKVSRPSQLGHVQTLTQRTILGLEAAIEQEIAALYTPLTVT